MVEVELFVHWGQPDSRWQLTLQPPRGWLHRTRISNRPARHPVLTSGISAGPGPSTWDETPAFNAVSSSNCLLIWAHSAQLNLRHLTDTWPRGGRNHLSVSTGYRRVIDLFGETFFLKVMFGETFRLSISILQLISYPSGNYQHIYPNILSSPTPYCQAAPRSVHLTLRSRPSSLTRSGS